MFCDCILSRLSDDTTLHGHKAELEAVNRVFPTVCRYGIEKLLIKLQSNIDFSELQSAANNQHELLGHPNKLHNRIERFWSLINQMIQSKA